MTTNAPVVVTGASGRIGREVCAALRDAGYRVVAVTRSETPPPQADEHIQITSLARVPLLTTVPSAVIHLAAEAREPTRMTEVNVGGCEAMLDWATRQAVPRFVYVSSVGIYGPRRSGTVTPGTPPAPANEYERTKAEAEQLVRAAEAAGRIGVTVLQPSNVFGIGPGWRNPLLGFIRSIARGRFLYVGHADDPVFNYVPAADVGRACAAVLGPQAIGRTFILNDPLPLRAAVEIIADALRVAPPRRRIPYPAAWGMALALEAVRLLARGAVPFDLAKLRELTNRTVYQGSDITAVLGFRYATGTVQGLRTLVAHYRAQALI